MTESTPIVDLWLPHDDTISRDCRLPIQGMKIRIQRKRTRAVFQKREEGLQDHKGLPWSVYFRRRTNGFVISLQ